MGPPSLKYLAGVGTGPYSQPCGRSKTMSSKSSPWRPRNDRSKSARSRPETHCLPYQSKANQFAVLTLNSSYVCVCLSKICLRNATLLLSFICCQVKPGETSPTAANRPQLGGRPILRDLNGATDSNGATNANNAKPTQVHVIRHLPWCDPFIVLYSPVSE